MLMVFLASCSPWIASGVRRKDLGKDVELKTDSGTIVLRLSDSTPLHRNNFIRLVKSGFYEGVSFHRVISGFMIQAGDPLTRQSAKSLRTSGADSTDRQTGSNSNKRKTAHDARPAKDSLNEITKRIPAEFRPELFHKKGVLAAAREGDASNPSKASSYSQFYIVQGRVFTDFSLDSTETYRLKGRKIPASHREVYKTLGGAPHLDQNYTIFGEVVSGIEVIDRIANTKTSGKAGGDKPLQTIRIKKMKLIKRN